MLRVTTVVVGAVAVAVALAGAFSSEASTPTVRADAALYQGRSALQWHRVAVARRIERDFARNRAGDAIRYSRRLEGIVERANARQRPDVRYAIHLAATAYGVSEADMNSVASCESGHSAFAQNGRYRGVFQEGPMFEGGPFGRAGFSVWDSIANAMTAAYTVDQEGWSQWECKP